MRVVFLVLVLAGCLSAPEAEDAAPGTPRPEEREAFVAEAPDLPLGRLLTYRASTFYEPDPEIAIVVAEKDRDGYLFAAAHEEDLHGEAVWGRTWLGRMTPDLADEAYEDTRPFAFPLHDGKAWAMTPRLNVTAREADVELPDGSVERGFVVEGDEPPRRFRGEYAPSVGWWTSYRYEAADGFLDELVLTGVGSTTTYVWYEAGPSAYLFGDETPAAAKLDVSDGFDAVVGSFGGARQGRAALVAPVTAAAPPWTFETPGDETWQARGFEATPGTWALAAHGQPGGWGFVAAMAVKWVRGSV